MVTCAFVEFADVHQLVRGLPHETTWRAITLLAGLVILLPTFYFALKTLLPFVGGRADARRRMAILTVVPYFVIGTVNVGASLVFSGTTPVWILLLSGIGATFGSNSFLLWLNFFARKSDDSPSLTIYRSLGWYLTGAVCLSLHFLLARGIDF